MLLVKLYVNNGHKKTVDRCRDIISPSMNRLLNTLSVTFYVRPKKVKILPLMTLIPARDLPLSKNLDDVLIELTPYFETDGTQSTEQIAHDLLNCPGFMTLRFSVVISNRTDPDAFYQYRPETT